MILFPCNDSLNKKRKSEVNRETGDKTLQMSPKQIEISLNFNDIRSFAVKHYVPFGHSLYIVLWLSRQQSSSDILHWSKINKQGWPLLFSILARRVMLNIYCLAVLSAGQITNFPLALIALLRKTHFMLILNDALSDAVCLHSYIADNWVLVCIISKSNSVGELTFEELYKLFVCLFVFDLV